MAFGDMCNDSAFSHRPIGEAGVMQECDTDHFVTYQSNVGLDMNTLIADVQRCSLAYANSGAKEFDVQLTGNTPVVSVLHKQSSSCTMYLVSIDE
jgi:hypothetical protein